MRLILTSFCFLLSGVLLAQNQVGINQPSIDPSAVLDMNSTEKGFLLPRMTTGNRDDIVNPAQGLVIYETNSDSWWYFNGGNWIKIASDGDSQDGIGDADSDTRIVLDFTNDNDQIRFLTEGILHFRMNRQRFDVLGNGNTIKLGDSTAINDDGVSNNSVYIGTSSGRDVVSGRSNVGIGYQSMRENINESDNVAIGNFSARTGITARRNVSIGVNSLFSNVTTNQNTVIGHSSGESHTGSNNLHTIGIGALRSDISGANNIGLGTRTLSNLTTPNFNVAIGYEAGLSNLTAAGTLCVGYRAGATNLSADRFFIGNSELPLLSGSFDLDEVSVFDNLYVTEDIVYTGDLIDVSDRRLKENIKREHNILPKLIQLDAYRYHLKSRPKDEFEYGLIAQEVKKVFPTLVRRIDPNTDKIGVSYVQFISLILQGEKEQFAQLNEITDQQEVIEKELDSVSSKLDILRKKILDKQTEMSILTK